MGVDVRGAWKREEALSFLLETRIPVRLAIARDDREPLLLSLWYAWYEDALWCATQNGAAVVAAVRAGGRCSFEVAPDAPPYRGVRGSGRARVVEDRGVEMLERLLGRYRVDRDSEFARWLWSRREDEVALRIDPERLFTWDFGDRMGDAVPPPTS